MHTYVHASNRIYFPNKDLEHLPLHWLNTQIELMDAHARTHVDKVFYPDSQQDVEACVSMCVFVCVTLPCPACDCKGRSYTASSLAPSRQKTAWECVFAYMLTLHSHRFHTCTHTHTCAVSLILSCHNTLKHFVSIFLYVPQRETNHHETKSNPRQYTSETWN